MKKVEYKVRYEINIMNKVFVFLFVIILSSCVVKSIDERLDMDVKVEKIEVENPQKILASNILDSLLYIVLDNSNELSLIKNISKIEFVENDIYMSDLEANKIFKFNNKGDFISLIGSIGQGPGEYVKLSDFAIDYWNKELLLLDKVGRKVNAYDFNGDFIRSFNINIRARNIIATKEKYLYYTAGSDYYTNSDEKNSAWEYKKGFNLFSVDKKDSKIHKLFYYKPTVDDLLCEQIFDYDCENNLALFHYSLYDTIYQFSNNNQILKYAIDFKSNKIPLNDVAKDNADYYFNKTDYSKIINTVHSDEYLFVNYTLNNRVHFFIKNKNDNTVLNVSYLKNDIDKTSLSLFYPYKIINNEIALLKRPEDVLFDYKLDSVYLQTKNGKKLIVEDSNPVIVIGYMK